MEPGTGRVIHVQAKNGGLQKKVCALSTWMPFPSIAHEAKATHPVFKRSAFKLLACCDGKIAPRAALDPF